MDFMNLHQAAHGDREFGFIETRLRVARKTVVGHWQDPQRPRRIAAWIACRLRLARGAPAAGRPLRRQHAPRRRHRGRQGRGPDPVRRRGQRLPDERPVRGGRLRPGGGRGRPRGDLRRRSTTVAPELGPGGARRAELREAARIEIGLRTFLTGGGFGAFTDTFEDLGGPTAAARDRRPAPDGRRVRLRRRGRLEERCPRPAAQGDGDGSARWHVVHGGLHLRPRSSRPARARCAHARSLPIAGRRPADAARSTRCRSAAGRTRSGSSSTRPPGPAIVAAMTDLGDRFRIVANVIDIVEAAEALPRLPVARAVWQPRPDMRTAVEAWLSAGAAHHTVLSHGPRRRAAGRLRRDGRRGAPPDRRGHQACRPSATSSAGTRPTTTWPAASRHVDDRPGADPALREAVLAREPGARAGRPRDPLVRERQRPRPRGGHPADQAERGALRRPPAGAPRRGRPRRRSHRRG